MSTTTLRTRLSRLSLLDTPSICRQCLTTTNTRQFSTTNPLSSKVGSSPLIIPSNVSLSIYTPPPPRHTTRTLPSRTVTVQGPLGQVTIPIPHFLNISVATPPKDTSPSAEEAKSSKAVITINDPTEKTQRQMWGTARALLANNILGVTEGHAALIRFVGVGYRAIVQEGSGRFNKGRKIVNLKLGYSHPIMLRVPDGVTASAPVPTRLLLEGINKEVVNSFAAEIRRWRIPEPYKGKGIFVNDETIKLKAKKIK
ncbi:hypothetical protein TWF106_009209 [Orbilia oligospora]|uniref:Large ribosomal subunit protein uL6 alpha-beta domain-containing protein n=1 Tax=Orbilia oligospora TaxID=2813651 RepID=A0A6G1MGE6_ORBOL|nr:hypothetical protein TWF788_008965 [Orbilia oligospora]KAF3209976.1 hypothetical protein TWF679_007201 [Orbilia oligospora]KAF3224089.1 hypothetical protein TWF191_006203 [Orbilia oligospora]KAF3227698.1 hypothetical protein TWF106_009209 [Orbilia oligospora]KAF3255833.1 hypothetical protein TWF192_002273 [Orbilia oligospora]